MVVGPWKSSGQLMKALSWAAPCKVKELMREYDVDDQSELKELFVNLESLEDPSSAEVQGFVLAVEQVFMGGPSMLEPWLYEIYLMYFKEPSTEVVFEGTRVEVRNHERGDHVRVEILPEDSSKILLTGSGPSEVFPAPASFQALVALVNRRFALPYDMELLRPPELTFQVAETWIRVASRWIFEYKTRPSISNVGGQHAPNSVFSLTCTHDDKFRPSISIVYCALSRSFDIDYRITRESLETIHVSVEWPCSYAGFKLRVCDALEYLQSIALI